MRFRKYVKNLNSDEKKAFVDAVLKLAKKKSVLHPNDGNRNRYDDFAELHMNAMMRQKGGVQSSNFVPGWAHNAPAFFPWHRVMILAFENELNEIDSNVTLPYWDWTDPNSNPFTDDFLGTNGDPNADMKVTDGPFAYDGLNHWTIHVKDLPTDPAYLQRDFGGVQVQPTALPTKAMVNDVLGLDPTHPHPPYEKSPYKAFDTSFRARAEVEIHNLVHNWVGGTMGKMTSPNDPVFFLHHCNIDRLWWQWQTAHRAEPPYLPVTGAVHGHNLHDTLLFHTTDGPAPFQGTFTPADVVDNLELGYTYESVDASSLRLPMSAVTILFGIINDAPGVWIDGSGHIHHGGGGPGDPEWNRLPAVIRDNLLGRAISQLAVLASDPHSRSQIAKAAAPMMNKSHHLPTERKTESSD